jgi:hypothetical protein
MKIWEPLSLNYIWWNSVSTLTLQSLGTYSSANGTNGTNIYQKSISLDNEVTGLWHQQIMTQPESAICFTSYFDIQKEHVLPDNIIAMKEAKEWWTPKIYRLKYKRCRMWNVGDLQQSRECRTTWSYTSALRILVYLFPMSCFGREAFCIIIIIIIIIILKTCLQLLLDSQHILVQCRGRCATFVKFAGMPSR